MKHLHNVIQRPCPPQRNATGLVFGLLLATLVFPRYAQAQSRNPLRAHRQKHAELHQKLVDSLDKIARYCTQHGLTEEAVRIRRLGAVPDSQSLRVDSLPKRTQPAISPNLPAEERYWRTQVRQARQDYARNLYLLSRRVLKAGYANYTYALVAEVALHDPDHKFARKILGYVRSGDEWMTPYAALMARRKYEWHDKFGWLPKNDIARYERGERHFKTKWMTAAQETEIRRDFRNAWEVRSDHFLIKTNVSLERGVEVAKSLEVFYRSFYRTFAGFFNTPEQIEKLFRASGSVSRTLRPPFVIHYYQTKQQYLQAVNVSFKRMGIGFDGIATTNGIYIPNDKIVYAHEMTDGTVEPTLYHEATHQLFYQSQPKDRPIAERAHFWVIEGIACYMESFKHNAQGVSMGDPAYERFSVAQYRYLTNKYYVPLGEFTRMGKLPFQTNTNIRKNYTQASGLAHFFMHYDGGRYRDALVEHLSQLYRPATRRPLAVDTLERLTGVSYAELDRQYGEHMKNINRELARRNQLPGQSSGTP